MSTLSDLIFVSQDERPFVDFEASIDKDVVVSGYIPVKSTLDVFAFLGESAALQSPRGRGVVCWGAYGSGKSRLCAVLARLFRDGFECPALAPVWQRFESRGHKSSIDALRNVLQPGQRAWRPWLIVPLYAGAGGGSISACLIRALRKAVRAAGLNDQIFTRTIYQEAVSRLREMLQSGTNYVPANDAVYRTADMLIRALETDLDERALQEFCEFHRRVTFGVDFQTLLQSAGGTAIDAHDVYNEVAQGIQQAGYDGIVVLWDEMGFAIEQLLSGSRSGTRNLGQEAMALQAFLERSCGTNELGKRIIFMGFTHVGITEYGTRGSLNDQDQNRLSTVANRFRQPDINIRLSVTETEGYHLVAGMLQRTALGEQSLRNPIPRLQKLADRMRKISKNWENLSAVQCYDDIAAPCYPLHPATVMVLLALSDQIAQVNRTTFYYLQSREDGGLAALLEQRSVPVLQDMGSSELARLPDLFRFFEQPLRARDARLCDQYDDAVLRVPDASEFEIGILRAVLLLNASRLSPTTAFLSFCLADSAPAQPESEVLQKGLARLTEAQALWQNAATDVWGFVAGGIIRSEVEKEIEDEKEFIAKSSPVVLFRNTPEIHSEIADFIGDFDLDPGESGIIRRLSVKILPIAKGKDAIERVNPAVDGGDAPWRSAIVYLLVPDTQAELQHWRDEAKRCEAQNVFFVVPQGPVSLGNSLHDLVAVKRVLSKKDRNDHAYKVLEGRLTKLRQDLRREFSQFFGNPGLRAGTEVVRAGSTSTRIAVESWNELLPSIATTLESDFDKQLRVRCGAYNEWQTRGGWGAMQKIVARILGFDATPEWQDSYLEFNETSQEAAIIDGVLLENGMLRHNALADKWEFAPLEEMGELVQEAAKHFQSGSGDKEFLKLYAKLIDPPFGIPNGVIPLIVALVVRDDIARIGLYQRSSGQLRRVESKLHEAIVDMAKDPDRYCSRFTKLSGKQRFIFKALGPELDVEFTTRDDRGEAFYEYCNKVRDELIDWASPLPEEALLCPDVTDAQRRLLKMLRGGVPPQISLLADVLLEVVGEDFRTHEEMADADSDTRDFPCTVQQWRTVREQIDRHVSGVRASLDRQIQEIAETVSSESADARSDFVAALEQLATPTIDDNPVVAISEAIKAAEHHGDLAMEVAAIVAKKDKSKLTAEDFGKATGVLQMAKVMRRMNQQWAIVLPSLGRRDLPEVTDEAATQRVAADVSNWRADLNLSADQVAFLAIRAIYNSHDGEPPAASEPATAGHPHGLSVEGARGEVSAANLTELSET